MRYKMVFHPNLSHSVKNGRYLLLKQLYIFEAVLFIAQCLARFLTI